MDLIRFLVEIMPEADRAAMLHAQNDKAFKAFMQQYTDEPKSQAMLAILVKADYAGFRDVFDTLVRSGNLPVVVQGPIERVFAEVREAGHMQAQYPSASPAQTRSEAVVPQAEAAVE